MSWWEALYIAVGLLLFVLLFKEGCDEPFAVRFFGAAFAGAGWGAIAVMIVIFMVIDAVAAIIKAVRK